MRETGRNKIQLHPETPHLVLCEGADAYFFLLWFLDFLKKDTPAFGAFRVYNVGGISEIKPYLQSLSRLEGFKKTVRSLCILRDAESNAASACQSIQTALREAGFAAPEKPCCRMTDSRAVYPHIATGFVLFPSCSATLQNGTLEDLCLRLLAQENAKTVLSSVEAALAPYAKQLPRLHKNRLHTYFSMTDAFVSLKLGEAAKGGAFAYALPEMEALRAFLLRILDDDLQQDF